MSCSTGSALRVVKNTLILCALTLALSGCAKWAVPTNALPPAPRTPGAVVTEQYVCIPHNEAAELMLWIEQAEAMYD